MSAGAGPSNAPAKEQEELAGTSTSTSKLSQDKEWLETMHSLESSLQENSLRDSCAVAEECSEENDLQVVRDMRFALKVQLQVMVEDRKRSKASKQSDFSAALDCQEDLLNGAIAQTGDAVLSRSIDEALATDSAALLEALREDEREREDRRMALRLSGQLTELSSSDDFDIQAPPKLDCAFCLESCYPLVTSKCKHPLCRSCVRELYCRALHDEELVPARCCNNVFEAKVGRSVLNVTQFEQYCARVEEVGASNPLYCPTVQCSRFLGSKSEAHERKERECPDCHQILCSACGLGHHTGQCIPDPEAENLVKTWAQGKQVQQCEKCRRFIELEMGCNRMTCKCGHEFCFSCTRKWRTCSCAMWEEVNLVRRAEAVAEVQNIPVAQVRDRLQENNRGGAECYDHKMRSYGGQAACDDCGWNMPQFFYRCNGCYETRCRRCMLFRRRNF